MTMFLVAAAAAAALCTTQQPGPINGQPWVCVNGGWLPPVPAPAPPPPPTEPTRRFQVGTRYGRGSTDVYLAGLGQLPDGTPVFFGLCQRAGEGCPQFYSVLMIDARETANGWTVLPAPTVVPTVSTTQ